MTISDKDITFDFKGKRYKVPFVIMAEDEAVLQGIKIYGVDLSSYNYEGRKLRMKDALMKLNYNNVIAIFSHKDCEIVLSSCFFENIPTNPLLELRWNF